MRRDLEKSIEAYEKKFYNATGNGNAGAFFASDLTQIKELSTDSGGVVRLYDAISYALEAGFMVGYRYGKKEGKKK